MRFSSPCILGLSLGYAMAFNMYPTINQASFVESLGISVGCLDALNDTVVCDQTLFQMSTNVDDYRWETDNVTALCTADCTQSALTWWLEVENSCASDTITVYSKQVPAASIAERFLEGLNITCLQPDTVIDSFVPSPINTTSSSPWCLIESQDWIGSDIVRPICPAVIDNSTDPSCSDPTIVSPENERIANLYDSTMLCSNCFLKIFHLRMTSTYLPDSDYSDYLVDQYQDVLNVCNASVTNLTIRALPWYDDAPGTYNGQPLYSNLTSTSVNNSISANGTSLCPATSQIITGQNLDAIDLPEGCEALSTYFGLASGDLIAATGDYNCTFGADEYCLPAPCTVHKVADGENCDTIASSVSTVNFTISGFQIQAWNLNMGGFCDDLVIDDYICVSAPGGSYVPPLVSNSTSDQAGLQRGGGDGSASAPPGSGVSTTNPQGPTQPGISTQCIAYYTTPVTGASCAGIENLFQISFDQLYAWNPAIGSKCQTLFPAYAYCVQVLNSKPSSTSATLSPTTISIPGPTQSGIISTCNMYYLTPAQDVSCSSIETLYNIAFAQFLAWNPAVGSNCQNLWPNEAYCVGVGSSSTVALGTTTASSSVSVPGPTQSGIISTCKVYFVTPATGASCADIESQYGLTFAQFLAWNPAVGSNCQSLWPNEAYCVGI